MPKNRWGETLQRSDTMDIESDVEFKNSEEFKSHFYFMITMRNIVEEISKSKAPKAPNCYQHKNL